MAGRNRYRIDRLAWADVVLREIALPHATLKITLGLGSGLSRRPADPPGRVWAIGDRGPNLKVKLAVNRYGLTGLASLAGVEGVKILPLSEGGPVLAELQITDGRVELVRTLPLRAGDRPVSGRPPPGDNAAMEPAFGLDGERLPDDSDGADTEALAALADGSFWAAEEYGPSLIQLDAQGRMLRRWTPKGVTWSGASVPILDVLPKAAGRRRLNRGFEALTASPDGRRLVVALQSAAADEPRDDGVPFWVLDAATGDLVDETFYPFDKPHDFERDEEAGRVRKRDLKVCDLVWAAEDRLLVLERVSRTTKIYAVELGRKRLKKTLVLDSDVAAEIAPDMEGLALLSDRELLLVNDNDFGIEGVETAFFRVTFDDPV